MPHIGGVTIAISADTKRLIKGLEVAENMLKKFGNRMRKIRVAGAIKGDPFSETNRYIQTAGKQLDKMFDSWSERIDTFGRHNLGKAATDAKKNVDRIIKAFDPLEKKLQKIINPKSVRTRKGFADLRLEKFVSIPEPGGEITKSKEQLSTILDPYKGISSGLTKSINAFVKNVDSGNIKTQKAFQKGLSKISDIIEKEGIKITKEYEGLAGKFKEGFDVQRSVEDVQKALEFTKTREYKRRGLPESGKVEVPRELLTKTNDILRERAKLILDARQSIAKSTKAIEQNFQVEKNRNVIIKEYGNLKKLGISLNEKEKARLESLKSSMKKMSKTTFDIVQARRSNLRILNLLNKGNISQEKALSLQRALLLNIDKLKKLGVSLTSKELSYDKSRTKELEKQSKALRTTGFLSKEWFKVRAKWFVELRLLWSVYRQVGEAIRSVIEYQTQLSRAMRTARSEFKSTAQIAKDYSAAMRKAIVAHGVDWKDTGEVLYQLTSAGLSSEEAIAGLNTALSLIVGTEGDVREVTKAVAGIYNNFKETITGVTTEQEKLQYITDTMATAWKNHQVEISELTDGYKYSSAVGKKLGVTFEDLTAILAVSNDHLIKGAKAGRALTAVWSRMYKDAREFASVFKLEGLDFSKHLDFMEIMGKLSKRFKDATLSADEIGDSFTRLGIRGTPQFLTILSAWEEIVEAQEELRYKTGKTAEIEEEMLNNLNSQWNRFLDLLKGYAIQTNGIFESAKDILKFISDELSKHLEEDYLEKKTLRILKSVLVERLEKQLHLAETAGPIMGKIYGALAKRTRKQLEEVMDDLYDLYHKGEAGKKTHKIKPEVETKVDAGTKKDVKRYISNAEKEFYLAYKKSDKKYRLNFIKETLEGTEGGVGLYDQLEAKMKKFNEISKDSKTSHTEMLKEMTKLANNINSLESERESILKGIESKKREEIGIAIKGNNLIQDTLEFEIKRLKVGGTTKAEFEDINKKWEEHYQIQKRINQQMFDRGEYTSRELKFANKKAKAEKANNIAANERALLQYKLNQLTAEYSKRLDDKEHEIQLAKINHATTAKILELEKEKSNLTLDHLEKREQLNYTYNNTLEREKELERIKRKIREENIENLKITEKQLRAESILYDFVGRMKDKMVSFHDMMAQNLEDFATGFAQGLGGIFTDITGGFQTQRQEVSTLKGELAELNQEYQEALSEGNIQRANELKNEMSGLRDNIEDLEDPIYNLKTAFKDFFKSLIDNIREAINQWIAMQIVMGVTGAFTSAKSAGVKSAGTPASMYKVPPGGWDYVAGTGGILPKIKSFQSFSRGGLTGKPTLALLGDNSSGRELVIPEENIKSDSVSGYVRDEKQPINIINILTKNDIAGAMAGVEGKRVIVNHIGRDLQAVGPISRQLRV